MDTVCELDSRIEQRGQRRRLEVLLLAPLFMLLFLTFFFYRVKNADRWYLSKNLFSRADRFTMTSFM